jgi:hypothetical protein
MLITVYIATPSPGGLNYHYYNDINMDTREVVHDPGFRVVKRTGSGF